MIKNKNKEISYADVLPALDHAHDFWKKVTRTTYHSNSTIIPLPNPYIVPSIGENGFAFKEQYYWDSYFICLGINDEKLVCGMLDNLIYLFNNFGLIPNANRYYFTSRSQPPILTTFIFHIYHKYAKSNEWLKEKIEVAKREYAEVWMAAAQPFDHLVYEGLSRYYDINYLHDLAEAESGWDMTPRFMRQCLDYIPIDLNCLLYKYEADFYKTAMILGNEAEAESWQEASSARKHSIDKNLWNSKAGFYFDYNYQENTASKVWSLAAYYALWAGVASHGQAKKLSEKLKRFKKKGGLTTTIGNFMYYNLFGSAKTQWAYPNGWAPLHYIVCEGLINYGYDEQAQEIAKTWITTCNDWYESNGTFLEKYNVVDTKQPPASGLYPNQTGFGWTNGVFVYFCEKYLVPDKVT